MSHSLEAELVSNLPVDDLSVCASVCPVHCGKTADQIRMPFGIIGRTGPGMRQVVGFGDRFTGRGIFGGEFGAHHCSQSGLYCVRLDFRSDAALFQITLGRLVIIAIISIKKLMWTEAGLKFNSVQSPDSRWVVRMDWKYGEDRSRTFHITYVWTQQRCVSRNVACVELTPAIDQRLSYHCRPTPLQRHVKCFLVCESLLVLVSARLNQPSWLLGAP